MTEIDGNSKDSDTSKTKKTGIFASSYFWAFVFAAAIAGWMLTGDLVVGGQSAGHLATDKSSTSDKTGNAQDDANLFKVRARIFHAKNKEAMLTLRGRTEADAKVQIRAETAGVVEELSVKKGEFVKKGTNLCRIETGAREATLLEAKATHKQAKADFSAAARLAQRGHTAKLKVAEMQAKLDSAKAMIKRAELDLQRTFVKAPFDGIIEDQPAKVGDFLNVGGTCAHLVSTDPLIIVGAVAERDIPALKTGMKATAKLVTGEQVTGKLRFISPASDANTRTFRIELEVKNDDYSLRDGVTAQINIPLATTLAHQFTPAILGLDDLGRVGVRTLVDGNIVKFVPVKILGRGNNGVWVSGLPEHVTVITVGQDYVIDGQKVNVVHEETTKSS